MASDENDTPVPTTERDTPNASITLQPSVPSTVTDEEWRSMQDILSIVYDFRMPDGHDPSKVFHRKVNKRVLPAYYDVIKEPVALSTIKHKVYMTKEYKNFKDFVRDFALIVHNAQVYNLPESGAYQDALIVKDLLEKELQKLVDTKLVTDAVAKLPYLGEIPEPDPVAAKEEEDDEDDEDESGDDSDDSKAGKKRRGRPRGSTNKRETDKEEQIVESGIGKKRGRPPRVDTPMEARLKNIMKGLRRVKDTHGNAMISHFDRLPDRTAMPEYFNEIKTPVAVDVLKKKLKRKKYHSVDQFMKDVDLMFENAKVYNEDASEIYECALKLQQEARKLADEEQKKPDSDFAMEDGRLPLPDGILHNGELYKVGDWVHIQNSNDLTKPIVTQIYRTWQDATGQKFVNACWYYRPEQTVHRFDKHFFPHEVVKTGQYRDHSIDEIVDRCFVMFVTRFNKGRPKGFPLDKEVYVCESRYNEEKNTLNKIKTWASCLPDEVRDKDYEMELYKEPKRMKKIPSPIAYLLKDEQKETDDLPKPDWGADNAPPKIGAVHRRPRDSKESPPPEPTPSPPPEPTPPPPRQQPVPQPHLSNGYPSAPSHQQSSGMTPRPAPTNMTPLPNQHMPTPLQHQRSFGTARVSPAPIRQTPASYQNIGYSAHTPQTNYSARPILTDVPSHNQAHRYSAYPTHSSSYKAPPPCEVWHLDNLANASIPPDIRAQFQCDEFGRVLFFTAPPLDTSCLAQPSAELGHSVKFLAGKAKREEMKRDYQKRKASEETRCEAERRKKAKVDEQELAHRAQTVVNRAIATWSKQAALSLEKEFAGVLPAMQIE